MSKLSNIEAKPIVIVGGGGHAKVLIQALLLQNRVILGIVDRKFDGQNRAVLGVPIIGDDHAVLSYAAKDISLVNGIGSIGKSALRKDIFLFFKERGYHFASVVHPGAIVAPDLLLCEGVQLMAGVVIQPGCHIGENTVINTGAVVDHDCTIGDHVHISPGSTICGGCAIEDEVHIGAGATVIQGVRIRQSAVIGAGALVLKDVAEQKLMVGVPAREVTK